MKLKALASILVVCASCGHQNFNGSQVKQEEAQAPEATASETATEVAPAPEVAAPVAAEPSMKSSFAGVSVEKADIQALEWPLSDALFDADKNLYVVEPSARRVRKYGADEQLAIVQDNLDGVANLSLTNAGLKIGFNGNTRFSQVSKDQSKVVGRTMNESGFQDYEVVDTAAGERYVYIHANNNRVFAQSRNSLRDPFSTDITPVVNGKALPKEEAAAELPEFSSLDKDSKDNVLLAVSEKAGIVYKVDLDGKKLQQVYPYVEMTEEERKAEEQQKAEQQKQEMLNKGVPPAIVEQVLPPTTATSSETATATATETASAVETPTETPVATEAESTPTPEATPVEASATPTATETPVATETATTETPTPSATASVTETATPAATATQTESKAEPFVGPIQQPKAPIKIISPFKVPKPSENAPQLEWEFDLSNPSVLPPKKEEVKNPLFNFNWSDAKTFGFGGPVDQSEPFPANAVVIPEATAATEQKTMQAVHVDGSTLVLDGSKGQIIRISDNKRLSPDVIASDLSPSQKRSFLRAVPGTKMVFLFDNEKREIWKIVLP